MSRKIRWGVLGVAKIGWQKVIPAMQRGDLTEVTAIASRDAAKAKKAAAEMGIPKAYGSYEELLADPAIDAIYNPLPNHLHVPWSIRAAEAGKHVLCEKPISLNEEECRQLIAARDRCNVRIGEAFMVRTNPQWLRVVELVQSGAIGQLRSMGAFFSYFNRDPGNIRNKPEWGGGGLMDIGCYPINLSRMVFGEEPRRVIGLLDRDPEFGTDRLTSAMLDYARGQCIFTCSTQMVPYQRVQVLGTTGRIELEIPFNALPDRAARILIDDGSSLTGAGIRAEEFPVRDQYTIQGDEFSKAILGQRDVPVPLEDALRNMKVIAAVFRSAESGRWEGIQ